jgi:hypothetical protein
VAISASPAVPLSPALPPSWPVLAVNQPVGSKDEDRTTVGWERRVTGTVRSGPADGEEGRPDGAPDETIVLPLSFARPAAPDNNRSGR